MRKTRTRKIKTPSLAPVNFGHAKAEIIVDNEVENPHFERAHSGERWNPKVISAPVNIRESTFTALKGRGVLDQQQIIVARKFLGYYEAMGGSGAKAIDYSKEPVDGGGAREAISDRQVEAGFRLKEARDQIGARAYVIVERIIGEGYTIAQISHSHRERTTNADYLKHALDDLAALWNVNKPANFKRKTGLRAIASL